MLSGKRFHAVTIAVAVAAGSARLLSPQTGVPASLNTGFAWRLRCTDAAVFGCTLIHLPRASPARGTSLMPGCSFRSRSGRSLMSRAPGEISGIALDAGNFFARSRLFGMNVSSSGPANTSRCSSGRVGLARREYDKGHANAAYDVMVDTSKATPEERAILAIHVLAVKRQEVTDAGCPRVHLRSECNSFWQK